VIDVFGFAVGAGGDALRDAAIVAGYQLGVFDGLARTLDEVADANGIARGRRRMRPLLDLLVAMGHLVRDGERVVAAVVPAPREVAHAGWGLMVDVFRADKALPAERGEVQLRYHTHLTEVGAPAAAELATLIGGASLIDLGCGAGTYTAAFLDAHPAARATGVDFGEVVPISQRFLARFGERVRLVVDDISTVQGPGAYEVALLANVVHLHAPALCQQYIARAARLLVPHGSLVIKDLRLDEDRRGPRSGLMFALNMAIYTDGGDVYPTSQLRGWCEAAQLGAIEEHRLESSPDSIVIIASRPRGAPAIGDADR
jgi:SAM-dependent methyltransferase